MKWEKGLNILFNLSNLAKACIDCCKINLIVAQVFRGTFKDKSEAINKFIELYGDDILDLEASEEYTKKVVELTNKHLKKYGVKKMSVEELDKLCGV